MPLPHEEIAIAAYFLWLKDFVGRPEIIQGRDFYWFEAERNLGHEWAAGGDCSAEAAYRKQSMHEEQIRAALNAHWLASAAEEADAEHEIYADDAICDYPQSGERIFGRKNLQALRSHHPGKPSGFEVRRILGRGDLWVTEYRITYQGQGRPTYTVSIMEFRNGKVAHETQYFADPFEAPAWRRQWVEPVA